MDELIQRLYDMTDTMVQQLESAEYEVLDRFVIERERLLTDLKEIRTQQQPSAHHQRLVQQVLEWDRIIQGRMLQLKAEAAGGLRKVNDNRKQHNAYIPAYAIDGVYFDTRK